MRHKAVTIDLDPRNLLWLEDQTSGSSRRNLSDVLNELVARARRRSQQARAGHSVKGTIEISADDPNLDGADDAIRALFAESLNRPIDPE